MAGMPPFGRDDQPLLEVKIIGGKRFEVAVDKHQENHCIDIRRTTVGVTTEYRASHFHIIE